MSELDRARVMLSGGEGPVLNAAQLLEAQIRNEPDVALTVKGGEWGEFTGRPVSVRDEPDGLIAEFALTEAPGRCVVHVAEITELARGPDDGAPQS